ncbi:TMEM165/GDT1 family protein [Sporosalibacterium faouarense]|uniref:TMEM165/GDT1 family protein n=1 Tax=Sporosalibacterium faouarense TaxID=516123 RepID=UPI00141C6F7F|nr:TMEM165/GDT1 family protein [Sporosalibacterium faouarense]MTI46415.1 TMEM165/GDT1 family protein [Bacillota bacterium]
MFNELISAFFFIFVAEMGDKTQILAMTFATQYSTTKVLAGVFLGALLNHGLAIILGSYLANAIPMNTVQIIAGIAFVGFGLWALRAEEDEDEENASQNKFGPVFTVALAFFIGELGDKTQLTAMTLATSADFPAFILMGTVLGMLVTSGIGIFIGRKVGEKIPEVAIKTISSAVFIFFGTVKLVSTVPSNYINIITVIIYVLVLGTFIFILGKPILEMRKSKQKTALKEVASTLYIQAHHMKKAVDEICLGEEKCGHCEGKQCLIGFARDALELAENEEYILSPDWAKLPTKNDAKAFDEDRIVHALSLLVDHMTSIGNFQDENYVVNRAREALEKIAIGETLPLAITLNEYIKNMKKKDKKLAKKIEAKIMENRKERKEKRE